MPHKWIAIFAHADWLVRKRIARTIHFQAAVETKSRVKSLFFGICVVYSKTMIHLNVIVSESNLLLDSNICISNSFPSEWNIWFE